MHRILIAILIFLSISWQMFVKLGVVVYYEYNKQYIAANLCENRDKPQLNCCGKCYLKKQLVRADNPSSNTDTRQLPIKWRMGENFVYILPQPISVTFAPCQPALKHNTPGPHFNLQFFHWAVFHPPLNEMV